jgi:hypothetical protein
MLSEATIAPLKGSLRGELIEPSDRVTMRLAKSTME